MSEPPAPLPAEIFAKIVRLTPSVCIDLMLPAIPGCVRGTARHLQNAVKAALGQLHRQEILMENLALRMRARHGHELKRPVEPHGFVTQGSEVTQIPARSTAKIKDGIRRLALDRVEECHAVLADIVVPRAVPE